MTKMELTGTRTTATTYSFCTIGEGWKSWALCTVNDRTGELLITSDWGNWSYRWDASPRALGVPSLTAFIGDRDAVDYIARKLQGRRGGQQFSAQKTVAAWRRTLCERRLEVGRAEIETRQRTSALTGAVAREIYDELGHAREDCGGSADLLLDRITAIRGFSRYVDESPYESLETEQTSEDRALRDLILPALIESCRETTRRTAAENAVIAAP